MTMISRIEDTCAVCKTVSEYRELMSTNRFGPSDLDSRPPEMMRSTMDYWLRECPECGYVAKKLSDPIPVPVEFIDSAEYFSCSGHIFESPLAVRFYRFYLIKREQGDIEEAFYAALHAAWVCDDAEDKANAKHCRELAIQHADELIAQNAEDRDLFLLIKADLLRRAERFDQVLTEFEEIRFEDPFPNRVLAFQKDRARKQDTACYTAEDVRGK